MKAFITALLISLFISISARSESLIPLEYYKGQGLEIRLGELTGAGSKFSIRSLEGLILPEGVLRKSSVSAIVVKNTKDSKISDIVKVKIADQEIAAGEFIGFIAR